MRLGVDRVPLLAVGLESVIGVCDVAVGLVPVFGGLAHVSTIAIVFGDSVDLGLIRLALCQRLFAALNRLQRRVDEFLRRSSAFSRLLAGKRDGDA